jgi:hypothetical protein
MPPLHPPRPSLLPLPLGDGGISKILAIKKKLGKISKRFKKKKKKAILLPQCENSSKI